MGDARRHARRSGSSLLECLAAIVVIGTATVAGFQLYEVNARLHSVSIDSGEAIQLVRREVERAKSLDFDLLATIDWQSIADAPSYETRIDADSVSSRVTQVTVRVRPAEETEREYVVTLRRYRLESRDD